MARPSLLAGFLSLFPKHRVGQVADAPRDYQAATGSGQLYDPGLPKKVGNKQVTAPTMIATANPASGDAISNADRNILNLDITSLRTTQGTKEQVAIFSKVTPEIAAAIDAYTRLGITDYTVLAYNRLTQEIDPESTRLLWSWIKQNDAIGDYTLGFNGADSIRSLMETFIQDIRHNGDCCAELVLNKARLPYKIVAVGSRGVLWKVGKDGKTPVPYQRVGSQDIDLDIPTFFRVALDQSAYTPYSDSPLESALQPILMAQQFLNDVRKVIRAAIHPRLKIKVDAKWLKENMPVDAQATEESSFAWMQNAISQIADVINGLEPEEALVALDTMDPELLTGGNNKTAEEYKVIESMATGKMAAGAKVLPAVIGRGQSQSTASVESMLFVKQVEGSVHRPLNEMFSRIMTLILRLQGRDVYVEFRMQPVNLRPELELEAFRAQKQARILESLSLGMLSDDEASVELFGRPGNFATPLSGTGFYAKSGSSSSFENPYAGGSGPGADGGGGALNENLQPKTPANKAGDN